MKLPIYFILGLLAGFWSGFFAAHKFTCAWNACQLGVPGQFWWNIPLVLSVMAWAGACAIISIRLSEKT